MLRCILYQRHSATEKKVNTPFIKLQKIPIVGDIDTNHSCTSQAIIWNIDADMMKDVPSCVVA